MSIDLIWGALRAKLIFHIFVFIRCFDSCCCSLNNLKAKLLLRVSEYRDTEKSAFRKIAVKPLPRMDKTERS